MQLVNIQHTSQDRKQILANAALERHPVVEEFVQAMSDLWNRTGISAICGACFREELSKEFGCSLKNRGCCGTCPNLSSTGCIAKPMGCASFLCFRPEIRAITSPDVNPKLAELVRVLSRATSDLAYDGRYLQYYAQSYVNEAQRVWTEKELRRIKRLTRLVKQYTKG